MRKREWLGVLVALMACGLIAAGCGSDDSTSSSSDATSADSTATSSEDTSGTEEATDGDTSGDTKTADDVYSACLDAIAGTPGEQIGKAGCQAAKTAFEQCATQSEAAPDGTAKEAAIKACQDAADAAVSALNSSG